MFKKKLKTVPMAIPIKQRRFVGEFLYFILKIGTNFCWYFLSKKAKKSSGSGFLKPRSGSTKKHGSESLDY